MGDDIRSNFEIVCNELNIDEVSKENAWQEYQAINNDYVLEGPHIEWLACALYVACRSSTTQTVEGDVYTGNSISLTQILRATKLRLVEFFRKIRKWLEMARLPPVYLEKVEALERKFEVISVIFNKYNTEYSVIFMPCDSTQKPQSSVGSRPRSRKPNKAKPCSSAQLFQFGWVLYIHIKNQFPLISDDLVNSHYLLLCCLDMLCVAVVAMKRKDLLNFSFEGLPEDYDSPSFSHQLEFPKVLSELCKKFSAIERECLVVRDYYWWPSVRRLYESQTLHLPPVGGNTRSTTTTIELQDVLQSLLNPLSFQSNLKSLNQAYELMVLQEGDFDERVFLNNPADIDCYVHEQREQDGGDPDRFIPPGIIYQSPQHLQYGTPLTNREYLSSKEAKLTPVSDANQSVIQLHLLLEGCSHTPSDELITICSSCANDPLSTIETRLQEMSQKFLQALNADSMDLTPDNFAMIRLQLSQSLYYKLLSAIVSDEERRLPNASNSQTKFMTIQSMLEHETFHKSLFALCVEVVLFSYNSHSRIFPWILSILDVSSFNFYKVIEVTIKVESSFPRAIVKHMSKIEESVLSSLAWKTGSPLFELLEKAGSVPCYADVALPESPGAMHSPLTSRLKLSATKDNLSPLSVRERYSSPIPAASRRQLFTGKRPPKSPIASSPLKTPHPIAPKPPQGKVRVTRLNPLQMQTNAAVATALMSLIQTSPQKTDPSPLLPTLQAILAKTSPEKKPIKEEGKGPNGQENIPKITLSETPQKVISSPTSQHQPQLPKRTGSVALFYRKVYQMAFLRIKDMCERLLLDIEILKQVWTCFEYSLMRSPDLMRDRHIDQLIMCSIYVVAKVLRKEVTFQEIMRQYRHQPQAKSHVYRSVLLNNGKGNKVKAGYDVLLPSSENDSTIEVVSSEKEGSSDSAAGTVSVAGIDTTTAVAKDTTDIDNVLFKDDIDVGVRGDIIQFYNKIFIGYIKEYVLKFNSEEGGPVCSMSPLPKIRRAPVSPRKVSKNHQIFVSPLKGSNQPSMSPLAKTFVVSKSPASDLMELNHLVSSTSGQHARVGARRQLDALLSRSPIVSSSAQRPCTEATRNAINRSQEMSTAARTSVVNGGNNSNILSSISNNNSTTNNT